MLSEPPTAGLPREFIAPQRSTKYVAKINDTDSEHEHPVEDDNNDTLTFMRGLPMRSGRAFFHKVRKTLINLIEALCFTKCDCHNVFDILYDL